MCPARDFPPRSSGIAPRPRLNGKINIPRKARAHLGSIPKPGPSVLKSVSCLQSCSSLGARGGGGGQVAHSKREEGEKERGSICWGKFWRPRATLLASALPRPLAQQEPREDTCEEYGACGVTGAWGAGCGPENTLRASQRGFSNLLSKYQESI